MLDGFVLLASTDGHIMYVTDNVQQMTGYHQVKYNNYKYIHLLWNITGVVLYFESRLHIVK